MPQPEPTAREKLIEAMRTRTCFCGADSCHNAEQYVDAFAHELAEKIRITALAEDGPATKWNWWDAATIPASCADLIDPEAQR